MAYRTLINDLTVQKSIGKLTDLFGNEVGDQLESVVYFDAGTILEDDEVAPVIQQAVEDGKLEGRLEKVSDSEAEDGRKLAEPFPGYRDMDPEDVQALFKVLPSESIRAIQEFEVANENRQGIVDYHIGRGEAFSDRIVGRSQSPLEDAEEKPSAEIVTREVTDSDVRFGESPNDDGAPQVEPGTDPEGAQETVVETAEKSAKPRGRAARKAATKEETPSANGDDKGSTGS